LDPSLPVAIYIPAQIRTAYEIDQISGQGQGMTVAIVDAYTQPNIASDINVFSTQFGLPKMDGLGGDPTLSIKVPTGQSPPGYNTNWGLEISLDVEWLHAIAPYANIILVTCQDAFFDSLLGAEVDGQPYSSGVVYAASLPGVSVVSNSWGTIEFSGETAYDGQFTTNPNVAFTFATGDSAAPGSYPAFSPNVVAVGGTSLYTKSIKGLWGKETGWPASGGGVSLFEAVPSYQSSNGVNFGARSIPDVSMDADLNTGVYVYDSPLGGYLLVGGTSLSCPMWAGLIALGDQARGSSLNSTGVLSALYGVYNSSNYSTDFHDVTTGNNGFSAGPGYDLVTGIGTPIGPGIVGALASFAPDVITTSPPSGATGASVVPPVSNATVKQVYSPAKLATSNSLIQAGPISFLVTTMDIAKHKKIGSILSS
jgi:subtilase family serine protease